jgi:AraC-like DNA-binding protein
LKIESKFLEHGQYLVKKELEDAYDPKSMLEDELVTIKGECLEIIKSRQISTKGLMILDTQLFFTREETDHFEISGECIVMDFIYGSPIQTTVNGLQAPQYEGADTQNIWYAPNYKATYLMPAFQQVNYVSVILSREFYGRLINSELHREFSTHMSAKKPTYLASSYLAMSAAMQYVIHEIRSCQRAGALKRMYIETKIRELLLLQLEMLIENELVSTVLPEEKDLIKLLEAKLILDQEYTSPPSLAELSRKVALNEFKLKKGFKANFGNTVRGYIIKRRMEQAKKLFKNKASSVSEVAYQCGYKDVSHFSAAFKTFYGTSPQKFKLNWNLATSWVAMFSLFGI